MVAPSPFNFARSIATTIARDRIGKLDQDAKAGALQYIDSTLELWKLEQVDEAGTVEIQPALGGLLGTVSLAALSSGKTDTKPTRVPYKDARPEQCAGPFVRCKADLWLRLWSDQYPGVWKYDQNCPLDLVLALLVEREAETMPVDSLAQALYYVWVYAWSAMNTYQAAIKEVSPELTAARMKRVKQLSDLRVARAISASRKRDQAKELASKAWHMAVDLFIADISLSNGEVVSHLAKFAEFGHLSRRGLSDRIKGAQTSARTRLAVKGRK